MKKYITIILLLTFSFQASASPYASNMTAAAQTKAIQMCFDKLLGKAFAPDNLEKFNLGEGKYLDQLGATKALIVWSLGGDINTSAVEYDLYDTLKPSGSIFAVAVILLIAGYLSGGKLRDRLMTPGIAGMFLSYIIFVVMLEYSKKEFLPDILAAESNQDLYEAIADMDSEIADRIRKKIIKGCNVIAEQVDHYVKNPDLLVLDLETMRKNYSPTVLVDIRIPSLENAEVATRKDTSHSSVPVKSNDRASSSTPTSAPAPAPAPANNTKPGYINVADNGTPVTTCDQLFLKGVYKKASIDGKEADIYMKFESQFGSKKTYSVITNSKADFSDTKSAKKFNASLGQVYEQSTGINHCALTEYPDIGVTTTYLVLKVNKDGSFVLGNNLRHTAAKYNVKKISEK
jgi:hypothetical protein